MMIGIVKNIFEIGSGLVGLIFQNPNSQSVRVASLVAARSRWGKVWWPVSPLSRAAI